MAGLSDDADRDICLAVAGHPSTPASILLVLAAHADIGIRWTVARNGYASFEALQRLAGDHDERVRASVASNSISPASILDLLSGDTDVTVRQLVAAHRNTSGETLNRLLDDPDQTVRTAVAANPSTPLDALLRVLGSSDAELIDTVLGNSSMSAENLVQHIKQGWITSGEVLTKLAFHQSDAVRAAVAICPQTPLPVLEAMVQLEKTALVHCAIAMNDSLTISVADLLLAGPGKLEKWAFPSGNYSAPDDYASYVVGSLLNNPNTWIKEHVADAFDRRKSQYCSASCTAYCTFSCTKGCTGGTGCTYSTVGAYQRLYGF